MKKQKRLLATLGIAGMLALTACATTDASPGAATEETYTSTAPTDDYTFAPLPSFLHASGVVTEIESFEEGNYFVMLQNEETDQTTRFLVDQTTALLFDGQLKIGMTVTGYFDSNLPAVLIYPPQHRAVAIVHNPESPHLLDRFDANLVNSDGIITLNITDDTEIIFQDGTPFEGSLFEFADRKLFVEFPEEGRVVTPTKVTILFELAAHPTHDMNDDIGIAGGPALLSPEDVELMWANMFNPETVQIIVKDEVIEAPTPFTDSTAGTIMLPLIAIAEALGYVVVDNGNEVIVGPGSIVTADVNSYFRGRETPRELTSAPVMRDGIMFVPWEFFHEILSGAAFVTDGDIHVVELEF